MKLIQVLPSTTLASGISVTDFADYIKQNYTDDQVAIDLTFNAAVQYCEGILAQSLTNKTVKLIGSTWGEGKYDVTVSGTLSTLTVNYYDADNTNQTLSLGSTEKYLEQTGMTTGTLVIIPATFPSLFDRKDAIRITMLLTPTDTFSAQVNVVIFQIGAYLYECRVNDKEPQMTVVDKMLMAIRQKEF